MLTMLIKHEFKSTWKIMGLICAVLVITGIISGIFLSFVPLNADIENDKAAAALGFSLTFGFITYLIIVISLSVLSTGYLVIHYYRSLYTSQGYLSFTLPASIPEVISSRMIVGCIWSLISGLCLSICIALPILGLSKASNMMLYDFFYEMADVFELTNAPFLIVEYIILAVFSTVSTLFMYYFCISVGQLWQEHKIVGAIICYFATNIVLKIFSAIASISTGSSTGSLGFGMFTIEKYIDASGEIMMQDFFNATFISGIIYNIITIIIFVLVSIYISNKKLNLD
ncbi:MAG: hypothetical protein K6A23_11910 [Butyrivibrio sp.]|nr:hypothetical protein [Butyrivibrio sp.]